VRRHCCLIVYCWAVLISTHFLFGQADPSIVGQYSSSQSTPYRAIHAHMLPTGKVMFWDSYAQADNAQLWDPSTGSFAPAAHAGYNIFCTGFSFLRNGHLLVTGGHIQDFVGLPNASDYDPFTNTWTPLANMNQGRWYPTGTTLANGNGLVVSGQIDTTVGMNPLPQIWQPALGTWQNLTTAQLVLPFYPYMYVAPNGKVFNAGPNQTTRYLDTSGTGAWAVLANNNFGTRTWGSSVMYDSGKVMILGGSTCPPYDSSCTPTPTKTTEIIDLNTTTPAWTYAAPMANARKQHNTTLLPDGKVLVTGGSAGAECETCTSTAPVYSAEMWNPATNVWTTMASLSVYRGYHSVAVLLPDGRVFSAGGNFTSSYEIFSPPYLFKGSRPTITSAPASVGYGQTFFLATPNATSITKVTWLALSTVTHTFNAGQRLNVLNFSQASGGLNVTTPSDANLSPPGYVMLFIINSNEVPSVAAIVRVDSATITVPVAPSGLTAGAVSASQINLSWTANSSNQTGFNIQQSTDGTNFSQTATVGASVTSYSVAGLSCSKKYYFRVQAFNSAGTSGYSNTASATTWATSLPAAPGNLTASATSPTRIALSWQNNASNASGIQVQWSTDGSTFTNRATVGPSVTSYIDSSLRNNVKYYYRVSAFNCAGPSGYSNTASATP
jgi:galactose oxidase